MATQSSAFHGSVTDLQATQHEPFGRVGYLDARWSSRTADKRALHTLPDRLFDQSADGRIQRLGPIELHGQPWFSEDSLCESELQPIPDSRRELQVTMGAADHGNTNTTNSLSGVFGRLGPIINFSRVTDGLANTLFMGEILPDCHDHDAGWWHYNGMGNAHASTSAPLNLMCSCPTLATATATTAPQCFPGGTDCRPASNWNYTWGFKSGHKGGVHFVMGDGAVRFINQNINYQTYQNLGSRADGKSVSDF